jgi:hypothetical protein
MVAGGGADPRAHSLAQPLSTGMSIGIPRIATIPTFMRTPILTLTSFTCMNVAAARFRGDTGLARSEKIAPQSHTAMKLTAGYHQSGGSRGGVTLAGGGGVKSVGLGGGGGGSKLPQLVRFAIWAWRATDTMGLPSPTSQPPPSAL